MTPTSLSVAIADDVGCIIIWSSSGWSLKADPSEFPLIILLYVPFASTTTFGAAGAAALSPLLRLGLWPSLLPP